MCDGSIPACTGKPSLSTGLCPIVIARHSVYPRVYGEILWWPIGPGACKSYRPGVYPRVYGETQTDNPSVYSLSEPVYPRVYGETLLRRAPRLKAPSTVYPRVYGETNLSLLFQMFGHGLSPRVRGNPSADLLLSLNLSVGGLSPRVRGNHLSTSGAMSLTTHGSIPACTGKPPLPRVYVYHSRVYPRVYGETSGGKRNLRTHLGLSPRVRGNPNQKAQRSTGRRSIPACTGKPSSSAGVTDGAGVYPRVYGETSAERH